MSIARARHLWPACALAAALSLPISAQDGGGDPPPAATDDPVQPALPSAEGGALAPGVIPAAASAAAVERWTGMVDALRAPEARDVAIDSFQIQFDLRARTGRQSNDLLVEARFMRPSDLWLELPRKRAIGTGPAGPWLRESDGRFIHLAGREYASDQQMLASTVALARNYLALADPHRIRLASLESLEEPPATLPEVRGLRPRSLRWIEIVTPDFKVLNSKPREESEPEEPRRPPRRVPPRRGETGAAAPAEADAAAAPAEVEALFRVSIGLDRKSLLPEVLILRAVDDAPPEETVEHCIQLREFRASSGLLVPWRLDIYQRWPLVPTANIYGAAAAQEIDLIRFLVQPNLRRHDFIPEPWR